MWNIYFLNNHTKREILTRTPECVQHLNILWYLYIILLVRIEIIAIT